MKQQLAGILDVHCKSVNSPWVGMCVLAGRLLLGGVFLLAGLHKAINFPQFYTELKNGLLNDQVALLIAFLLPGLEITTGFTLFSPKSSRYVLWLTLLMLIVFSSYITFDLLWGGKGGCNCFKMADKAFNTSDVVIFYARNGLLGALNLFLLKRDGCSVKAGEIRPAGET